MDDLNPAWARQALVDIKAARSRVAIVGCGYVGLTLAVEAARAGFRVTGVDVSAARVKELQTGTNPVPDVYVLSGTLTALRDEGRLAFTTELTESHDVYVICVNTPLRDGSPDLHFIEEAGASVGKVLQRGSLVVLESTTYPGTTEELLGPLLTEATGLKQGEDFALAHSPERINPGDRQWTLRNTPKVVGGVTPNCTELAASFYSHLCDLVHPVSSPRTAEITKLLENSYRMVNIALANEMAIVCRDFDIDPWEVVEAATTKPYGFTPFKPGPGVGGECVPVDPQYLAWRTRGKSGRSFRMLEAATDINDHMPPYVAQRASEILNDTGKALRGAHLLLLGVSFKGGAAETKVSPAIRVAELLTQAGAKIRYHDPYVPSVLISGEIYDSFDLTDEILGAADLVIVLTDHPEVDYRKVAANANCVYDTRGVIGREPGGSGRLYRF